MNGRLMTYGGIAVLTTALAACGQPTSEPAATTGQPPAAEDRQATREPDSVTVALSNAEGQSVGQAVISQAAAGNGVSIALSLRNLSAGERAVHIHQTAKCDPPDFQSAGPHFNPEGRQHGTDNPEGPHAGDLPNITVGSDGTVETTITNSRVTLGDGANSVFANGGTALVVHAAADDMKTDPAGDAGARIACGTITR